MENPFGGGGSSFLLEPAPKNNTPQLIHSKIQKGTERFHFFKKKTSASTALRQKDRPIVGSGLKQAKTQKKSGERNSLFEALAGLSIDGGNQLFFLMPTSFCPRNVEYFAVSLGNLVECAGSSCFGAGSNLCPPLGFNKKEVGGAWGDPEVNPPPGIPPRPTSPPQHSSINCKKKKRSASWSFQRLTEMVRIGVGADRHRARLSMLVEAVLQVRVVVQEAVLGAGRARGCGAVCWADSRAPPPRPSVLMEWVSVQPNAFAVTAATPKLFFTNGEINAGQKETQHRHYFLRKTFTFF